MKKVFLASLIVITVFFTGGAPVYSTPTDFEGGVNNEYEYEELVFLSGKPIVFCGDLDISERERDDSKSISYKFNLTPRDDPDAGKLTRKIKYEIEYTPYNDKGQTIAQTNLSSYSETVIIGEDKYSLEDYQFSKSDVIDNRPASDFYSGSIKGRKYYEINKDEGKLIIDISGGDLGYENFWGSTETQILDYEITCSREMTDEEGNDHDGSWEGTVQVSLSDSAKKILRYADNEAIYSSFQGGHMKVSTQEMFSQYDYNLPRIKDNVPDDDKRRKGKIELSKQMMPRVEKLIVPKFRDTGGHWAEEDIKKLYSLDVFDDNSSFFVPDLAMSRMEFTRAVIKACNIRIADQEEKRSSRSRKKVEEISPFADVPVDSDNYSYVKEALSKEIINGVSPGMFKPEASLTRAQAITILIRALGFENNAPNPGYYTGFSDDMLIPDWSRDSVYVAREIGLIQGDSYNRLNPQQVMTRAEASAMIVRFLDFLQNDLQKDYRDDIILYN